MSGDFDKYRTRGAYHWRELSRNPFRGWPYTRSRVEWVVRQCGDAERILEVGCGDAAILARLAQRGKIVSGVDVDASAIELARGIFSQKRLVGNFYSRLEEVGPGSFDAIILAEVIEHIEEPHPLLASLTRRMSDSGRLILTTPIRLKEEPQDPHHVHEFTPSELVAELERHFREVRMERMHPVWLIDLMCYTVRGVCPFAVGDNLIRLLTGVELLDRFSSPLSLFWTQGAVCRYPIR